MSAPAFWQLWRNPIFRRYCRSRLRVTGLSAWLLIVLLIAGFLFFAIRTAVRFQINPELSAADAERFTIIPLMVVQSLILFFLGTGQVAGGMTAEADEGVLDYQRLTPLSPLTKVLGYLFGLPVREYVLFAATLPFTAWALWKGEVPFHAWGSFYAVFLSSAVLYHLTGLVAGTVVKNRRWAFLVSIAIVFILYTVMPQVARFGLTTFKYFTVWPVFEENLAHFIPRRAGGVVSSLQSILQPAKFFNLNFSETVFTLFSQSGLIVTFLVMLWRRWRRAEAHLLSKFWAVGLLAWLQLLLLGNALPLIEPGSLFPARQFSTSRFVRMALDGAWRPTISEAMLMTGVYGLVIFLLLLVLTLIITPTRDGQSRGLRRARKLGLPRLPVGSDASTAFWFVLAMVAVAALGWDFFIQALLGSRWFLGLTLPAYASWLPALVLFSGGVAFHALLERWGGKAAFLAVVFIGAVPIMIAGILTAAKLSTAALWIALASPAAALPAAVQLGLPTTELSLPVARALGPAFWFWQTLTFLTSLWLAHGLWRHKKSASVTGLETPD